MQPGLLQVDVCCGVECVFRSGDRAFGHLRSRDRRRCRYQPRGGLGLLLVLLVSVLDFVDGQLQPELQLGGRQVCLDVPGVGNSVFGE